MIREHERVVLTAHLPGKDLEVGDVGTVVHIYKDGEAFELEFTTLDDARCQGNDIAYNGITVCRDGIACAHDESALATQMAAREIDLRCDLNVAHGEAAILTTDLSHAYIDENRRTS